MAFPDKPIVSLEAPDTRMYATQDPRGFLADYTEGAVFDEIQKAPDLLSYLQGEVDRDDSPGRFILTGSENFTLSSSISQSLSGRTALATLLPLSAAEVSRFSTHPESLFHRMFTGSYPAILDRNHDPQNWLSTYLATYLERDVRQILNIGNLNAFQSFVRLLAGNAGQILSMSRIGADSGVSQPTAMSWLSVLETGYIVYRLNPYHSNLRKRLTKRPKLYFYDTGLLCRIGLKPVTLGAKEGLALINGTQTMTAITSLAYIEACRLADAADAAAAMSLEVLLGTTLPFSRELIGLRPHRGAIETAKNLLALVHDSEILISHKACDKVQDAYSLRCVPQVHGATRDALRYIESVLSVELSSVTDNPLLMDDGTFVSGGNFHGQPIAFAADHLSLCVAELADISERRIERLLNPDLSGLPAFLSPDPGLNSGFMIAQYTAASLVSENKVLAHPASVDSIPVSGSQEDHVSMGTTAAYQAMNVLENSTYVIATEFVCAAQAAEFIHRGKHGRGTGEIYRAIREKVEPLREDRQFAEDIEAVAEMISSGVFSDILNLIRDGGNLF
jgi:hypothetical protein